jgi:hypothetical protein
MNTNTLLEPGNHALLLIDHQYLQLLTLRSHEASAQVVEFGYANRRRTSVQRAEAASPVCVTARRRSIVLLSSRRGKKLPNDARTNFRLLQPDENLTAQQTAVRLRSAPHAIRCVGWIKETSQ